MSLKPLPWSKLTTRTRIGETASLHESWCPNGLASHRARRPHPGRSRCASSAAAEVHNQDDSAYREANTPLGHLAKQKEEDKQFFADLLTSAATKRDARAYLSRLKSPARSADVAQNSLRGGHKSANIFRRSTAVETSPVFQQTLADSTQPAEQLEIPHVALVKLSGLDHVEDGILRGVAGTLAQLARLSMLPCIVVDEPVAADVASRRQGIEQQVDRLLALLDEVSERGGRKISDIMAIGSDGRARISMPTMLFRAVQRGKIPVIVPIAHDEATQRSTSITADEAILAVTQTLSCNQGGDSTGDASKVSEKLQEEALLDRIIVIDQSGGIPSTKSVDRMHVFVNMAQEYHALQEELRSSTDPRVSSKHASNLAMLRRALQMLPSGASGLITTPEEASNSSPRLQTEVQVSSVGTRRQRNPLIHNLLTDKPAYSSSLPSTRLSTTSPTVATSTFVKRGMPLTILPNPAAQTWIPSKKPWIKLIDPRIDLDRLVYLINDSFDRTLDTEAYLRRVNDSIAGVIIAGDYEGGAILTWERPGPLASDNERLVPYLDKFAVLKKAQGAGGVADILFNAMVRTCFPNGVCWRSRKDNPVNKWYFERSRGTWKIPDMNWTMFWTTPDVVSERGDQTFLDYEAVCRGIQPTWMDGKKIDD